jgi:hypothetical protein
LRTSSARSTRFVSQLGNCAAAYCNPDCPLFCARLLHFLCRDQLGCETTCTHRSSRPQSAQRSVGYVFHMAQNRSACAGMPAASGYKFRRGGLSWYGLEVMSSGTSVPFTPYSAPHLGAIPNLIRPMHTENTRNRALRPCLLRDLRMDGKMGLSLNTLGCSE